ncbi:TonB-dependent siderophore receptor [Granulicella tundricola]|uniref:TonB-dependent siderophore receptor n=1 Tax=Granulicella tundricola (strain ATCC BAA-1859 / DSM 23138 / MP5ACTX9) TaxID=1198114 RepID=E8X248_GRATM|nr:TonB-dependent siderophore receptor [Granulicella tundricola]ADW70291.1 TonB-dependent siderophore receptor [Granulicella tundricola MP5ACTX9]
MLLTASVLLFCSATIPALAATTPAAPATSCSIENNSPVTAVTIHVTDPSGAMLDRAAIELRCGSTVLNGITGKDGSVTLSLHPGSYILTAQAPGFADVTQPVQAPVLAPIDLQMPLGSATDTINVSGDSGFVPYASNAGSKTNALLIEVPQSISIISQQEMEARNVITMNEALRYTPGIQADEYGVEPRFDWLKIRGFDAQTFGVYRDGMRFNSLAGKLDPFELESVEVLKGPSSVLYGEVPPGGLINQVSKRPSSERSTVIEGQFGQYDRRQGAVDTTGPIDRAGVFRYRLLGLIRNSNTQTNFTPDDRRLIAPSLSFHPSDRTNLTLLADYQHDKTAWSQFLPSQGTLNSNPNGIIPVSTFLGEPGFDGVHRNQASVGYTGDHLFSDGWNVHSNYRYQYINFQGRTIYGNGFDTTIPNNTTLVTRTAYALPNINRINTVDTRALRRFVTGNWQQTVIFGYDYQHIDIKQQAGSSSVADLNIFHPVYGVTTIPALFFYQNNDSLLQQHGLYAQDQIKFKQHFVFTLGGRQDFARNDISNFLAANSNTSHSDVRFTGRAGVTWLTGSGIAPYFAYSTSFLPNAGSFVVNAVTNLPTDPAKASDARQLEGGVKIQPRTTNSFITASVFQINETNVLVADAAFNNHQSGEVRSRGVEIEGVASLSHGLNLHAGYTLTATNTVQDITQANIGKWLPQTPRNQVSGLIDYTQRGGRFAGLGGNFGVRFVGTNAADSINSFFIPNYALTDAGLRFGYRHTLFSINATNLADKRYVATCSGASYCYYGYARNVIGTAKYHF